MGVFCALFPAEFGFCGVKVRNERFIVGVLSWRCMPPLLCVAIHILEIIPDDWAFFRILHCCMRVCVYYILVLSFVSRARNNYPCAIRGAR